MNDISLLHHVLDCSNNLINSDAFLDSYRIGNAFSRKRKLSFQNALYFILGSSKKALSANLSDFADFNPFLDFPNISKQAFSKARAGIHFQAFKELFRYSAQLFYRHSSKIKLWNNHLVLAIDGTTLQLPDTFENRNSFGFIKNQHSPGRAMASASALYDVLNDVIIDAGIGKYGRGERLFAFEHLDALDCFCNLPPSIITFDRGYPSRKLFHSLHLHGLKFVIRVASNFKITNKFTQQDICFSDSFLDSSITLRSIRLPLPGGKEEQLVTNLISDELTPGDFGKLYFLRWGIEGKFKELKSNLQIEEFTGNRPLCIKQDFFTSLFLSNLVALAKREADLRIRNALKPSHSSKRYQATRTFLISRIKNLLIRLLTCNALRYDILASLLNNAIKMRSQIMPDRTCERKKHLFCKRHYKNMKTSL